MKGMVSAHSEFASYKSVLNIYLDLKLPRRALLNSQKVGNRTYNDPDLVELRFKI